MVSPDVSSPEERLRLAVAQYVWRELHETGFAHVDDDQIEAIGRELGIPDHLIAHTIERLQDDFLLVEGNSHGFFKSERLAAWHGENHARSEWREGNVLRHRILEAAVAAYEAGRSVPFKEDGEMFIDVPWTEGAAASRILEAYGLVEIKPTMGHNFHLSLTADGYDLVRDEAGLRRELPRTATEDEKAHAPVVPDVLGELVRDCEQMLEARGWTAALQELRRGDAQYRDAHWADAVAEYYAAVESGLKHRLADDGVKVKKSAALRDLAKRAAEAGVIPANYQAVFGFLDSIRSPRKHGRGPEIVEVEVGPAESLLLANHARALLVYLGHRPSD